MIKVTDKALQQKIEKIYTLNQQHIFKFWPELSAEQQNHLLGQLNKINFKLLEEMLALLNQKQQSAKSKVRLAPAEVMTLDKRVKNDARALRIGEEALRKGQVAAFLVAGGQGTRLGFNGPKGLFPITPVKRKSLFQLFAEKLAYLNNKYATTIPWYIMTSETNHEQTVQFFQKNNYFGLDKTSVSFFKQDMLPAFDRDSKLIMQKKHSLFFNPNGHGGSLLALQKSGSLKDMQLRGIKHLFYFQVDNVLINMCDPVFLGYHIEGRAEMSTKVVRKTHAREAMGIICKINQRDGVVEYSDLAEEDMFAKDENGRLKYWAGNTAIDAFDVAFLQRRAARSSHLPFHLAEKRIPAIDEHGRAIRLDEKNGVKFETFIFDLLFDVQKSFTMEVAREKEFSAVKNKEGKDSQQTAQADLLKNYARLLLEAGIKIKLDPHNLPVYTFEISPLFAGSVSDLIAKKNQIPEIKEGTYLG